MLLDIRTYTVKPGTLNDHLALYAKMGKEPQVRHLGEPLAFLTCETPDPNQYVHIWVYKDAADREAKRNAMWADPDWLAYVAESRDLGALIVQKNQLVRPVDFFPAPGG